MKEQFKKLIKELIKVGIIDRDDPQVGGWSDTEIDVWLTNYIKEQEYPQEDELFQEVSEILHAFELGELSNVEATDQILKAIAP